MKLRSVRALLTALCLGLGTAALIGSNGFVATAQAATVRPEVGKPLKEAQELASHGKYSAALEKVKQAASVSKLTSEERKVIDQMRNYIGAKSGNASIYENMIAKGQGNATVARNLVRAHYMAHQYSKVIADAPILRKYGAMDAGTETLIAQAYYLTGNYGQTIKMLKNRSDVSSMKMVYGAAFKLKDHDELQSILSRLILATGDKQYWKAAIDLASAPPTTDHETLYLLRLRLFTDNMRTGSSGDDDYSLLAQIAIQLGFPGEAQAVLEKGVKAGIVKGLRAQRLIKMATDQAAAEQKALDADAAKARNAPNGDALVKIGETYWGYGAYKKARDAIEAGIKKGVDARGDAQMALGLAEVSLGNRDAASKAFRAVTKKDGKKVDELAHWYEVFARSSASAKMANK